METFQVCVSGYLRVCVSGYLRVCISGYLRVCVSVSGYHRVCVSGYLRMCVSGYLRSGCRNGNVSGACQWLPQGCVLERVFAAQLLDDLDIMGIYPLYLQLMRHLQTDPHLWSVMCQVFAL